MLSQTEHTILAAPSDGSPVLIIPLNGILTTSVLAVGGHGAAGPYRSKAW
jgi:hypothetical protein